MTTDTRKRTLLIPRKHADPKYTGDDHRVYGGGGQTPRGTQETTSWRTSGSPEFLEPDYLGSWDSGHEFYTTKTSFRSSYPDVRLRFAEAFGVPSGTFTGSLVFNLGFDPWPAKFTTPRSKANMLGTQLINSAIPNKPQAGLAQFVGELRDLPQLFGHAVTRHGPIRGTGGEFLNVEFGWAPFIRDLQKAARSLQHASAITRQLLRDSGKVVRRRRSLPNEVTFTQGTTSAADSYMFKGLSFLDNTINFSQGRQPILSEVTRTTTTWFSGAFTYHLPDGDDVIARLNRFEKQANHLLGLELDASVVWELAPWSWLADWNGTIGKVLSNASLLDGVNQVMRYGYLMRETHEMATYRLPTISFRNGWVASSVTNRYLRITKERFRATPYGFGLDVGSYSPVQWAILGALGMSKAPRTLP